MVAWLPLHSQETQRTDSHRVFCLSDPVEVGPVKVLARTDEAAGDSDQQGEAQGDHIACQQGQVLPSGCDGDLAKA